MTDPTKNKNPLLATLLSLLSNRNTITIHRPTVDFLDGDLEAAMILEQLLYWTPRASLPDGWIAKNDAEWQREIYLKRTRRESGEARLILRDLIETDIRKWNNAPTKHYRVKLDQLEEQWVRFVETYKSDLLESTNEFAGSRVSSLTESTPETTDHQPGKRKLLSLKPEVDPRWNFDTMGDYTTYPQDVWEHLVEFCVCFGLRAPAMPAGKKKLDAKSRAGLWITELRELKDACRPTGPIAIRYYRFEFEKWMVEHEPHAGPHDVDKPGSIKNKVAGMVAKIQSGEYKPLTESPWQLWKEGKWQTTPKSGNNGRSTDDQAAPLVNKKF